MPMRLSFPPLCNLLILSPILQASATPPDAGAASPLPPVPGASLC